MSLCVCWNALSSSSGSVSGPDGLCVHCYGWSQRPAPSTNLYQGSTLHIAHGPCTLDIVAVLYRTAQHNCTLHLAQCTLDIMADKSTREAHCTLDIMAVLYTSAQHNRTLHLALWISWLTNLPGKHTAHYTLGVSWLCFTYSHICTIANSSLHIWVTVHF